MTLGQLLNDCKMSLKCFEKGVELFLRELNIEEEDKKDSIKSSIARAYSSIAELYMNSDLWYIIRLKLAMNRLQKKFARRVFLMHSNMIKTPLMLCFRCQIFAF